MKKIIFLTLLALPYWLFAQEYQYVPFPDSGVVWSEMYNPGEQSNELLNYERFTLTGEDTLINGIGYKKLYLFLESEFNIKNAKCIGGIREDSQKRVYFKGDTIIHRYKPYFLPPYPMDEIMLYDFSVEIGDTIQSNVRLPIIVKDIDTIKIGNTLRKVFSFDILWTKWIEGIGNSSGLLFSSGDLPTDGTYGDLICFIQNGEVLYHYDFYDNCFPSLVSAETKQINFNILVCPNPANRNNIRFEWGNSKIETIEIFDMKGSLLGSVSATGKTSIIYSSEKLFPGIYLYKATGQNGSVQVGKIVVN